MKPIFIYKYERNRVKTAKEFFELMNEDDGYQMEEAFRKATSNTKHQTGNFISKNEIEK